ncbi:L,D-transpeptidase [Stappia sp. BW2]|jgi:lipoprotein-anchoring transpeptidase ErfK/SrfK|uniref:L,D-transpeptidase n=1 Tax=Stappia sp. BW2 TaxID=2592622 RepID=UPI0011DED204|nr:L,D-transpeptidase [Stappia sp. BW2]TYC78061.1 L,D-transpeptidase [Stappia sp. BW2]
MASKMSRRTFVAAIPLLLAACQSQQSSTVQAGLNPLADGTPDYATAYAARTDGGFAIPAIQYQKFDPKFLRQVVFYPSKYPSGTIVVDPKNKFLYLIQPGGRAIRYGIGVGRAGFAWNGEAEIRFKREWPKWFPPEEMIERDPKLAKYRDGQDGGPRNPIGARGLYLWQNNKDTLYRIHSTNHPSSIGTNASSGCIRMWHQDIIDLYNRVNVGTKVVVLG